jgi:hypothetical protein
MVATTGMAIVTPCTSMSQLSYWKRGVRKRAPGYSVQCTYVASGTVHVHVLEYHGTYTCTRTYVRTYTYVPRYLPVGTGCCDKQTKPARRRRRLLYRKLGGGKQVFHGRAEQGLGNEDKCSILQLECSSTPLVQRQSRRPAAAESSLDIKTAGPAAAAAAVAAPATSTAAAQGLARTMASLTDRFLGASLSASGSPDFLRSSAAPAYLLMLLRGLRNGLYYGIKIRLPHALVRACVRVCACVHEFLRLCV